MSYTTINFKTKKKLKEAISSGIIVTCYNPNLGPNLSHFSGTVYLEGPHFPNPHSWYATAKVVDGIVRSIK